MAKNKNTIGLVAWILVVIGGLNWGLALFDFNLVTLIFGTVPILVTIVYGLVGLSALWMIYEKYK